MGEFSRSTQTKVTPQAIKERNWPMEFATMFYSTGYAIRPHKFAVASEERGFDSVIF